MKKTIYKGLALVAMAAMFASCAESVVADFQVPAPEGAAELEELYSYKPIKEYIDREKYPNFKLSTAVDIFNFNEGGFVRSVAPTNFDEIVVTDGMKMGSIVKADGSMNFKNLRDLLDGTDRTNITVFGHALAANSTQPSAWLNSVIADVKSDELATDCDIDFSNYTGASFPTIDNHTTSIVNGVLTSEYPKKKYSFYISPVFEAQIGNQYEIVFECKGELKEKIGCAFGESEKQFAVDTDWTEYAFKLFATNTEEGVIINAGRYKGTLEFKNIRVTHYPLIQQTPAEKAANLTEALGAWYSSMMEECAGRVSSWNLISEPLADGTETALNGKACLDLKHGTNGNNEFCWQDYFGSEKYAAIASKAASDAWSANGGNAGDLKLYVDEAGLENPETGSMKLESLIEWIKVWEANGAKIDGIGCQMHINFSENKEWQKTRADQYVAMLKKLVATGKVVRISALDMGYQNNNASSITSASASVSALTDEQHQNMANFYRYIIQMYLKIVPAAQQGGICQWSLSDQNQPVGLWTKAWERKAAYVGFCQAFSEPIPETEDYFDYLNKAGLTHYICPAPEAE